MTQFLPYLNGELSNKLHLYRRHLFFFLSTFFFSFYFLCQKVYSLFGYAALPFHNQVRLFTKCSITGRKLNVINAYLFYGQTRMCK